MLDISNKDIIELRIKCLSPFVAIASKHDLEKDVVIEKAEKAWGYATLGLTDESKPRPGRPVGSVSK